MTDKKIVRSYRLTGQTLGQIDWLAQRMGDITDTDVITAAVLAMFRSAQRDEPVRVALELFEDGYGLFANGAQLLTCSAKVVEHLPPEYREGLLAGQMDAGSALASLSLAAAALGESMVYHKPVIRLYASPGVALVIGM